MWKKILPIAAVLVLGWIGLNLITGDDDDDKDSVAAVSEEAADDAADTASAAADAATDAAEEVADTAGDAVDAATDAAEEVADTAGDAATDVAEEASDTASAAVAATTAAVAATAAAVADAADTTEDASDTQTADAATGSADENVEMRYPTDPVTGATLFDQGMVEVVIEPTDYDAPPPMPVAPPAPQPLVEPPPSPIETRDYPTVEGPRYPTDPVTGLTIYDQVMILPDGTEVPVEITTAATDESGDADSASQTAVAAVTDASTETGNRLPVDPVTGATIFPESASAETAAQTTSETETSSETASAETEAEAGSDSTAQASNRLPVDPVTGATIFPESASAETAAQTTAESEASSETAGAETEAEADSDSAAQASNRLPVDPVTGASILPESANAETAAQTTAESETSSETASAETEAEANSESAAQASARLPVDPVTGATIFPEQTDADSDTPIQTAVATQSESVESTSSTTSTSSSTRTVVNLGGLSRQLGNVFGTTTIALERAVDEESAMTALPVLETASDNLTSVTEQISALPETARSPLNRVISSGMSRLKPLVDTTMTREGVGDVLSEVVTPMMETMESMSE